MNYSGELWQLTLFAARRTAQWHADLITSQSQKSAIKAEARAAQSVRGDAGALSQAGRGARGRCRTWQQRPPAPGRALGKANAGAASARDEGARPGVSARRRRGRAERARDASRTLRGRRSRDEKRLPEEPRNRNAVAGARARGRQGRPRSNTDPFVIQTFSIRGDMFPRRPRASWGKCSMKNIHYSKRFTNMQIGCEPNT